MLIFVPFGLLLLPLRLAALAAVLAARLLAWAVRAVTQSGSPAAQAPATDDWRRSSSQAWGP